MKKSSVSAPPPPAVESTVDSTVSKGEEKASLLSSASKQVKGEGGEMDVKTDPKVEKGEGRGIDPTSLKLDLTSAIASGDAAQLDAAIKDVTRLLSTLQDKRGPGVPPESPHPSAGEALTKQYPLSASDQQGRPVNSQEGVPAPGEKGAQGEVQLGVATFDQLETEFMAIVGSQARLRAVWTGLDFNGNGAVSLAEIDKWVVEQYPLLDSKPALMRAYKRTTSRAGGGDGDAPGTTGWRSSS
jgi:hypothetical protein